MEVPQVDIKQEKLDNYTVKTEPNVKYETQSLDVPQIKLEPVKLESCSDDVSIRTNLDQQLEFSVETKMIENDTSLYQSQSKQEGSDVKLEGSEEIDIEIMGDLKDKKWKIENEELIIKEDENVSDEGHRKASTVVSRQRQRKASAASDIKKRIITDNLYLKKHIKKHHGFYKCDQCDYQTTYKRYFKMHFLKHNHSDDQCEFQTHHTSNLKVHSSKHKNSNEMYKCDQCEFQTAYKGNLKVHSLKHKDSDEVDMYKCYQCDYQTIYKGCLKKHSLKHKNSNDVDMFKCNQCDYQTVRKNCLKRHSLTHKNSGEVDMYKCDQTVHKRNLKIHSLKHKNSDEVDMYKCDQCDYQTVYKGYLKIHSLKPKNSEVVDMYKCDQCDYQTIYKNILKKHSLRHKNGDGVDMYKCQSITKQFVSQISNSNTNIVYKIAGTKIKCTILLDSISHK